MAFGAVTGVVVSLVFLLAVKSLGALHPALAWIFLGSGAAMAGLIALAFLWLTRKPEIVSLERMTQKCSAQGGKALKAAARQLSSSPTLPAAEKDRLAGALRHGRDLREPVSDVVDILKARAVEIIRKHAVIVFASTAVSQNAKLDVISVLVCNARMVSKLSKHFGVSLPIKERVRIYGEIALAALVADQVEDIDFGVLGGAGNVLSDLIGAVPGLVTLAKSATDGSVNALVTLRIGYVARTLLLNAGTPLVRSEVRRAATIDARGELPNVVKNGTAAMPGQVLSGLKTLVS